MTSLSDTKLDYEYLPHDPDFLMRKITKISRTLKIKAIKGGFLAQIRPIVRGKRQEVSEIADNPQEALVRLDHLLDEKGFYDE